MNDFFNKTFAEEQAEGFIFPPGELKVDINFEDLPIIDGDTVFDLSADPDEITITDSDLGNICTEGIGWTLEDEIKARKQRINVEDRFIFDNFPFDGQSMTMTEPEAPKKEKSAYEIAEVTLQSIRSELSFEDQETFDSFDHEVKVSFIATVQAARAKNKLRTDWAIHLSYRKALETINPDPEMVEKTRLSNFLLKGNRHQAQYIF